MATKDVTPYIHVRWVNDKLTICNMSVEGIEVLDMNEKKIPKKEPTCPKCLKSRIWKGWKSAVIDKKGK